jgi:hypothetical protein
MKKKIPYTVGNQNLCLHFVAREVCNPLTLFLATVLLAAASAIGSDGLTVSSNSQPSAPSQCDHQRHLQEWNPVKIGVADYISSYILEEKIQAKYDIEIQVRPFVFHIITFNHFLNMELPCCYKLLLQFQDVKAADYNKMVKPLLDNGKEVRLCWG